MSMGRNNPPQITVEQSRIWDALEAKLKTERTAEAYAWPFKTRRTTEETVG